MWAHLNPRNVSHMPYAWRNRKERRMATDREKLDWVLRELGLDVSDEWLEHAVDCALCTIWSDYDYGVEADECPQWRVTHNMVRHGPDDDPNRPKPRHEHHIIAAAYDEGAIAEIMDKWDIWKALRTAQLPPGSVVTYEIVRDTP